MKHPIEELSAIAYHYFAPGGWSGEPDYTQTVDFGRQQEAHARASVGYGLWSAMLQRIAAQFCSAQAPDLMIENLSLFLQSPTMTPFDRCFTGALWLPVRGPREKHHALGFAVSFVVPCYVVYSACQIYLDEPAGQRESQREIRFQLSPDEVPYARGIAQEIEASYPDHEPMPPEVGKVVLPDLNVLHDFGEVTLYDCLFTSNW
jgi:hypothetical protein